MVVRVQVTSIAAVRRMQYSNANYLMKNILDLVQFHLAATGAEPQAPLHASSKPDKWEQLRWRSSAAKRWKQSREPLFRTGNNALALKEIQIRFRMNLKCKARNGKRSALVQRKLLHPFAAITRVHTVKRLQCPGLQWSIIVA